MMPVLISVVEKLPSSLCRRSGGLFSVGLYALDTVVVVCSWFGRVGRWRQLARSRGVQVGAVVWHLAAGGRTDHRGLWHQRTRSSSLSGVRAGRQERYRYRQRGGQQHF